MKFKTIQDIIHLRERIRSYWRSLAEQTFCRDLAPGKPLFLANVQLALNYHFIHVLIGRCFISSYPIVGANCTQDRAWLKLQRELVDECINSAVAIVDLCQMLHSEKNLLKLSYEELSSCYMAVIAIMARYVSHKDDRLRDACRKGFGILQEISTGPPSTDIIKNTDGNMDGIFERLDHVRGNSAECLYADGYKQFQNWVASQEILPREGPQSLLQRDQAVKE